MSLWERYLIFYKLIFQRSYKDYNLWSGGPTIFHKTSFCPRRKGCIDKSVLLEVSRESNYPIKYTKNALTF